jgi:hypothetical protein
VLQSSAGVKAAMFLRPLALHFYTRHMNLVQTSFAFSRSDDCSSSLWWWVNDRGAFSGAPFLYYLLRAFGSH